METFKYAPLGETMRLDRKKFYDGYRKLFGPLSTTQVVGMNELLDLLEADPYISRIPHAAYLLATVKHETANTFRPIHEYGSKAYFIKRYGGQTRKGRELGNDTPEEGYYYSGAGYPQTTGESNFEKAEDAIRQEYPEVVVAFEERTGKKFDLTVGDQPNDEQDPANMMDPAIAYATMSYGMRAGMFTGHRFSDYLDDIPPDYKNARKIINGLDRATLIASYAKQFEKILKFARRPVLAPDPATAVNADAGSVSEGGGGTQTTPNNPPPVSVSGIVTKTYDSFLNAVDKVSEAQNRISKVSWRTGLSLKVGAFLSMVLAFFEANWEFVLIGAGLVVLALVIFYVSYRRSDVRS